MLLMVSRDEKGLMNIPGPQHHFSGVRVAARDLAIAL